MLLYVAYVLKFMLSVSIRLKEIEQSTIIFKKVTLILVTVDAGYEINTNDLLFIILLFIFCYTVQTSYVIYYLT